MIRRTRFASIHYLIGRIIQKGLVVVGFTIFNRFLHVLVALVEGRILLVYDHALVTIVVLDAVDSELIVHHIFLVIIVIGIVQIFSVSSTATAFSSFALFFVVTISNIHWLRQLIINLLHQFVLVLVNQVELLKNLVGAWLFFCM